MAISSTATSASNPMYSHTLSEFILAGNAINVIKYPDLCFKEKIGSIVYIAKNILPDYLDELKKNCITITLSEDEQRKYKFNPKRLAADVYNSTDLYYIILKLNGMADVREFNNIETLQLLTKDDLSSYLSTIYSAEKNTLDKFNSVHNV